MKQRFRLYRRNGIYYAHDSVTGKQASLGTRQKGEALELFSAQSQAHRQAQLNLQLARTYLTATDPAVAKRTWQTAMDQLVQTKQGKWGERWQRAIKEESLDLIRDMPIFDTKAEHFLRVLATGGVSTMPNRGIQKRHNRDGNE